MVYGIHYGRTDLERYGIFAEMEYLHGKGYTAPINAPQIRDPAKRQMFPGFPKWKTGLQDCYFDEKFKRLFIGEAYSNPAKRDLKERLESSKLNRGKFRPPSYTHLHATPGDYYGCFTGVVKSFDPRTLKKAQDQDKEKSAKNRFIPANPGKKGGFGYIDITINKYPKYIATAYEPKKKEVAEDKAGKRNVWKPPSPGRFFNESPCATQRKYWVTYKNTYPAQWARGRFIPPNPTRTLGGCMDGCFSKWPSHSYDFYIDPWKISKVQEKMKKGKEQKEEKGVSKFFPPTRNKTFPTTSIMNRSAALATNNLTWRTMQPVTFTREFL